MRLDTLCTERFKFHVQRFSSEVFEIEKNIPTENIIIKHRLWRFIIFSDDTGVNFWNPIETLYPIPMYRVEVIKKMNK